MKAQGKKEVAPSAGTPETTKELRSASILRGTEENVKMLNEFFERPLEPPDKPEPSEPDRETMLEYAQDYFKEFAEFAESYVPGIVAEFWNQFDWRNKKWLREGVTLVGGKTV